VALSVESRLAFSVPQDKTLRVCDMRSGQCLHTFQNHTGEVNSVALSGDGRLAISGSSDKTLRVWDLSSGRCHAIFPCEESVSEVAFAPTDPVLLVAGLRNGEVLFFRLELR
jgi:WD40 repeat protein